MKNDLDGDLSSYDFAGTVVGLKNFVGRADGLFRDLGSFCVHDHWSRTVTVEKTELLTILNWQCVFACPASHRQPNFEQLRSKLTKEMVQNFPKASTTH